MSATAAPTATRTAAETATGPERDKARIDQWLWFARFAKSRSLAARLCNAGVVRVNGTAVRKPNQAVRVGDCVAVAQGGWQRTVRVSALGLRRGPAAEARSLYQEEMAPLRISNAMTDWIPLLDDSEPQDRASPAPGLT